MPRGPALGELDDQIAAQIDVAVVVDQVRGIGRDFPNVGIAGGRAEHGLVLRGIPCVVLADFGRRRHHAGRD
jgi:hypothetical protein